MDIHPEFPAHRRQDPKRQAELLVYEQLRESNLPGMALYEARPHRNCRELDFAIWLEDVARFGGQVKGGVYRIEKGVWYLATPTGEERKASPMKQLWDSTMGLHDFLQERVSGGRNPFIVPVLIFPNMDHDDDIEAWAVQAGVQVLFRAGRLVERLVDLAATCKVYFPPTAPEIVEEVELVIPGQGVPVDPPAAIELQARQVVIQHASLVNVYTMPAEA